MKCCEAFTIILPFKGPEILKMVNVSYAVKKLINHGNLIQLYKMQNVLVDLNVKKTIETRRLAILFKWMLLTSVIPNNFSSDHKNYFIKVVFIKIWHPWKFWKHLSVLSCCQPSKFVQKSGTTSRGSRLLWKIINYNFRCLSSSHLFFQLFLDLVRLVWCWWFCIWKVG